MGWHRSGEEAMLWQHRREVAALMCIFTVPLADGLPQDRGVPIQAWRTSQWNNVTPDFFMAMDGCQRQCWNYPRTEIWWTDGDPRDTHCLALLTWTQQEDLWRCMEEVGRLFWTIYGDLRESQEPLWEGGGVKRRHSDIKEISRNGVVLKGWGMRQLNKERELVFLSDTR